MAISAQGPGRLRTAELEEECLRLRREGLTHRQIAARLGVAPSTAYKRVRHGLDEINQRNVESAEQLRTMELARLDELQNAIWERATEGELRAIDAVLRIMERRAKLVGLDTSRHTVKVSSGDRDRLIEDLTGEVLSRAQSDLDAVGPRSR